MVSSSDPRSAGTGVRATRQRGAIIALLDTVEEFRSAQELHDELRRRGKTIGLTTVYRRCAGPTITTTWSAAGAGRRWRSVVATWRPGPPTSPPNTASPT